MKFHTHKKISYVAKNVQTNEIKKMNMEDLLQLIKSDSHLFTTLYMMQ